MKKLYKILNVLLTLVLVLQLGIPVFSLPEPVRATRVKQDISQNWKFNFVGGSNTDLSGKSVEDNAWEEISIPHTWNDFDGQDGGSNFQRGNGWYRKSIPWENSYVGKKIYIEFLGANMQADVYVNGNHLGNHKGGYTAFRYDITDQLTTGDNLIAVKVDNRQTQDIAPLTADFTFFGGIYREVSLVITDPVHIDTMDNGSSGLYLTTANVSKVSATLGIKSKIVNDSDIDQTVTINAVLRKPDRFTKISEIPNSLFNPEDMAPGGTVDTVSESNITIKAGASHIFDKSIMVSNPHLWNGMADPFRYLVDIKVSVNGNQVDQVSDHVGFRYFSVDKNNGFYLNGQSYPLRGVNRHQDRKNMGNAITTSEHDEDFGLIYEMGANALRLAHYPQAPYFYDLCDRYGIIVWAEIPLVDRVGTAPNFQDVCLQQMEELVRQQYNRPSICFWGLQNETGNGGGSTAGMVELMNKLNNLCHSIDPSRLTTQATNHGGANNWSSDLIAWNTYPGWYGGGTLGGSMDGKRGSRPVGISEYGAGSNTEQHQANPPQPSAGGNWHPEEYQNKVHEEAIKDISTRDYLWGTYVWNMFDFASDRRNEGDQPGINDKGLVTHDRKIKKDSFFAYKANWNDWEPFTHITSSRWNPRETTPIDIKVYSNCDQVQLTVGDKVLTMADQADAAREDNKFGIFEWKNIALAAGDNRIIAAGNNKDSTETYTDTVVWNKIIGTVANLYSEELGINNDEKTISLLKQVNVEDLPQILFGVNGATYKVIGKSNDSELTEGPVVPGVRVVCTSENGNTTEIFTFIAAHIAVNKEITASTTQSGHNPSAALDFNPETRWAASNSDLPQWIKVDLGDPYCLSNIAIDWFNSSNTRSYQYTIQVSTDDISYKTVVNRSKNTTEDRVEDSLGQEWARYVKINVTGCSKSNCNASINEIEINGWNMSSTAYQIDHGNRVIKVPKFDGVLADEIFLGNLDISGNCTYKIYGENHAYYVAEGEKLIITDSKGIEVDYYISLNSDTSSLQTNLALGMPTFCSGEEGAASGGGDTSVININDGKLDSRWAAPKRLSDGTIDSSSGTAKYPEWVVVDLGEVCNISEFELYLFKYGEDNRAYQYEILTSTTDMQDESFTQVADQTNHTDKSGHYIHTFEKPITARYVKLNMTGVIPSSNYAQASVYEFIVKGRRITPEPIETIAFDLDYVAMNVGDTFVPTYTIKPTDALQSILTWESEDPDIVSVEKGVLTAKKKGTTTITATAAFNTSVKDTLEVKVREEQAVSRGKDCYCSGEEGTADNSNESTLAVNINDGKLDTRWGAPKRSGSNAAYPEWIMIDLGDIYDISEIELYFYNYNKNDRSYTYEILAGVTETEFTNGMSSDAIKESLSSIVDNTSNKDKSGYHLHDVTGKQARYIAVNITGCDKYANGNKYVAASINELTVYGKKANMQSYSVGGTILNEETKLDSVEGLTISLYAADDENFETTLGTATASNDGRYLFEEVEAGTYKLRIEADELYQEAVLDVTVTDANITNADITLLCLPKQTLTQAKEAIEALLASYNPTNTTSQSDIEKLLSDEIINGGIEAVVKDFNKQEATTETAGRITGRIEVTLGEEKETIPLNLTIAQLSQNPQTLAEAKLALENALLAYEVTNETTVGDLEKLADELITNDQIGIEVVVTKVEATIDAAGNMTGTIKLTLNAEKELITVNLAIAKLLFQPQTLDQAVSAVENAIWIMTLSNSTTVEDVMHAVNSAITDHSIVTSWTNGVEQGFKLEPASTQAGKLTVKITLTKTDSSESAQTKNIVIERQFVLSSSSSSSSSEPENPGQIYRMDADTYNALKDKLAKAEEGTTVALNTKGSFKLPMVYLKSAANKSLTLTMKAGKYSWAFSGMNKESLPKGRIFYNFETKEIKNNKISQAVNQNDLTQIEVVSKTKLPFNALLTVKLGTKYANKQVYMYLIDKNGKILTAIDSVKVDIRGNAVFSIFETGYLVVCNQPAAIDK